MGKVLRIGVLTLSDKGSIGQRLDESGEIIKSMVADLGILTCYRVLPDEQEQIAECLCDWADKERLDLILTTGGTGLSPRDVTPEAMELVIDREVPGMAEAMRMASLAKTPYAMLSRGKVGLRGETLIVNLPGSPKAVRENLEVILPVLPHALGKLGGDPGDCGEASYKA